MGEWLGLLSEFVELWQRSRQARTENPIIDYEKNSQPNRDPWRWRLPNPDLQLILEDHPQTSTIHLTPRRSFGEIIIVLMGYGMTLMGLWFGLETLITTGDLKGLLIILVIFGGFGWLFWLVGSRVTRIELTPDRLTLVVTLGFHGEVKHRYRCRPSLRVTGAYQSVLSMDRDQAMPDFNLFVQRGRFGNRAKYITACNQTQGSWLVEGIVAWRDGLQCDRPATD
ncbi:hypothetical protein PN441_10995 [Spirulina major CS-329]|uniref:hypothetical protein n=1 Tax=Spirulina TaxID=1154 RepID=UPI0023304AC1|nr:MULTISPECIES: hypothetical protein [Spirulina]MDB9496087.1 hypothetical protein [Spirulina subsalsa CS-330]MDB9503596.1 hypothetical protein [Spirulina major CS-329]